MGTPDERRFRAAYEAHAPDVLAFALRRVPAAEDAADVVAETFTVAWRRLADMPRGGETRLWLFGVARLVLSNQVRAAARRGRLGERLRIELGRAYAHPDPADAVAGADAVRRVLDSLPPLDREVLALSIWEGLEPRDIATVLGLDAGIVRTRLSRARARARSGLAGPGDAVGSDGHVRGATSVPAGKEAR